MNKNIIFITILFLSSTCFSRDITFFVWSDTHFGACDNQNRLNVIEQMNKMPGREYPEYYSKNEIVAQPSFLMVLGDITESGKQHQ
ncbi:MAG: hypothetical protein ABFD79_15620 [Phycisphaerales bacterium]